MAARGGERPGAGRKPNAEKFEPAITRYTAEAAEYLPIVTVNMRLLAEGGAERVEDKWQKAGTITRKDIARDSEGEPIRDKNGKVTPVEVLVYPDLPAGELVMVERKVVRLPPEFKANEHFVNRVGGLPAPAREPDPDGIDLRESLQEADRLIAEYLDPDDGPPDETGAFI